MSSDDDTTEPTELDPAMVEPTAPRPTCFCGGSHLTGWCLSGQVQWPSIRALLAGSGEQPGECPECGDAMCRCGIDWTAPVAPDSTGLRERLWEAIVKVRDAAPRVPNDADSWDIVDAVLAVVGQGVTAEAKADGWDEAAEWVADPHIRRGIRQANPYRAVVRSGEQGGEDRG